MNIVNRLPDDMMDVVYKYLHQSYMADIKDELMNKIVKRWNNLENIEQYMAICEKYPTFNIVYDLRDESFENLIYPDLTAFKGRFVIIQSYMGTTLTSPILTNPTYCEILIELDNIFEKFNIHDTYYLQDVEIGDKIFEDLYCLDFSLRF